MRLSFISAHACTWGAAYHPCRMARAGECRGRKSELHANTFLRSEAEWDRSISLAVCPARWDPSLNEGVFQYNGRSFRLSRQGT
jgi:hypothetical protein